MAPDPVDGRRMKQASLVTLGHRLRIGQAGPGDGV